MKVNKIMDTEMSYNIKGIKTDSREIKKGDLFYCALGTINKNNFIEEAIKKGCKFVVTNMDINYNVPYLKIDNPTNLLKDTLDKFYHYPLKKITLIGVTGTDGKTTIVSILRDMLDGASIGTNGLEYLNKKEPLNNTTPSLDKIYSLIDKVRKEKIKNVIMEVSSESYLTNRIPGLQFDIGIFTNITKEHLDKHPNMQNYLSCKEELLKNSKKVILNHDTKYFTKIKKVNKNYLTYGKRNSDLIIKKYLLTLDKTKIWFKYNNKTYYVESPLLGEFNVYNLMAAFLTLLSLNYDINDIIKRVNKIKQVKGRMEIIKEKDKYILLDYAHTINATKNIFKFVKKYIHKDIITVIGCAGNRYKEKRPIIGKLALKYSKLVIFTSDDPRLENPMDIINEMINNMKYKNFYRIIDRSEAINLAIRICTNKDIILILGKGRDNYMAINNEYIKYNDLNEINKSLFD